jgi:hypothetical protein
VFFLHTIKANTMKKHFFFYVLFLFANSLVAQNEVVIKSDFSSSYTTPRFYLSGTTLKLECDTAYLINAQRMGFYRNLHENIKNNTGLEEKCQELIKSYEKSLQEDNLRFKALSENCTKSQKISDELIAKTQTTLRQTDATLAKTQQDLKDINLKLDDVDKKLRAAKFNSLKQKILVGAGGVGVGLLLGLLL